MKKSSIYIYINFNVAIAFISFSPISAYAYGNTGFMAQSFDTFSTGNEEFSRDRYVFTYSRYTMSGDFLSGKGYQKAQDALRYVPFVTLVNTGYNTDVKVRNMRTTNLYVNGVKVDNALPHLNSISPLNTTLTNFIDKITITTNSSHVLYGSGAKGGVVEIETLNPESKPILSIGGGYSQITQNGRSSYDAFALYKNRFLNIGFSYQDVKGQRASDSQTNLGAKFGLFFNIKEHSKLQFKADYYHTNANIADFNGFTVFPNYDGIVFVQPNRPGITQLYTKMNQVRNTAQTTTPSKETRGDVPYNDAMGYIQNRLIGSVTYELNLSKIDFKLQAFYHRNSSSIEDKLYVSDYLQFYGMVLKDVVNNFGGSSFNENSYGFNTKLKYTHSNGFLLLGTQITYNKASDTFDRNLSNNQKFIKTANTTWSFAFDTYHNLSTTQLNNAIYAMKHFNFGDKFALQGGVRYEVVQTSLDVLDKHNNKSLEGSTTTTTNNAPMNANYNDKETNGHLVFEIAPSFSYSSSGTIYARYTRGYTLLPAAYMAKRNFSSPSANRANNNKVDVTYQPSDLDDEIYDSFELGLKDFITRESISALFNINVFHIDTQNEFYISRNYNPGIRVGAKNAGADIYTSDPNIYGTYDKTRRMGIEIALEQYLFNGRVGLNESLSYTKSQSYNNGTWANLPYTYTYKATFGANIQIAKWLHLWSQSVFYGRQEYILKYIDMTNGSPNLQGNTLKEISGNGSLNPYSITDIGLNIIFKHLKISAGVRNIFDTLYFDYYNKDSVDTITNNGYLIGVGRTYFVNARLTF